MEILIAKDGTKVLYNSGVAAVIDVKDLEQQKADIEKRIAADVPLTDKELLAWAKINYPVTDHSLEVKELERITSILEAI